MSEPPDEIGLLCDIYRQLTASPEGVLSLSADARSTLHELMENSEGETDESMRISVLTALSESTEDTVYLQSSVRSLLRQEIEAMLGPILQKNELIHVPQYVMRMSDVELAVLIRQQLRKGVGIIVPEVELMQLVDIINRSASEVQDRNHILWKIGPHLKNIERRKDKETTEPMFEVQLPDDIAAEFLRELEAIPEELLEE